MNRPSVIFIDVDDTLVRSVGSTRIPMPEVIRQVRSLHENGHMLYLWSSGGADYARRSAEELGISECFQAFLPKPNAYIDDQAVHEWRFCTHVPPINKRANRRIAAIVAFCPMELKCHCYASWYVPYTKRSSEK